ncbi:MAG: SEC-C metal-binding domain-containing protein [Acidobacteriota bacterium]
MKAKKLNPLVDRAETIRLSSETVRTLARKLPLHRRQIHSLLTECIEGYFAHAFAVLSLAALHNEILLDACLLVPGARLLPKPTHLAKLAGHMTGDVAGALVSAVKDGRLSWQREATALFLAAWLGKEGSLEASRRATIRQTRMLARVPCGIETQVVLLAAGDVLQDPELEILLGRLPAGHLREASRAMVKPLIEHCHRPVLWELDEEDDQALQPTTRRRAVARLGRNQPCHCGSGKKYKRCCQGKDQERLRDSSDVAGLTRGELRRNLEEHLSVERIHSLRAHELAGLDPLRVDPKLYRLILNQLNLFQEFDAIRDFFASVGVAGLEGHFLDAVDSAASARKLDKVKALIQLKELKDEEWLGFPLRFLKAGIEEVPALEILEEEARRRVDDGPVDFAIDLLQSRWPHLGILVARGVAPLASPLDRETLLEELGKTRDRLDLSAVDPTEDLQDLWGWDDEDDFVYPEVDSADTISERDDEAWRELEAKELEVERLRQDLDKVRGLLEVQSRASERQQPKPSPQQLVTIPQADPRVGELKERVSRLKSDLSQRHAERNQLRRQLEKANRRLDRLEAERRRQEQTPPAPEGGETGGEIAPVSLLRFRLPVFSSRFRSSLEDVSEATMRKSVIMASRIAAGDQTAFRGTRRLQVDRDIFRQRIGRDYRLLFKLGPQELEVLDLTPRRDLERAIRRVT